MKKVLEKYCEIYKTVYVYTPKNYPLNFGSKLYFEISKNDEVYCMLGDIDDESFEMACFKTCEKLKMFFDSLNCD